MTVDLIDDNDKYDLSLMESFIFEINVTRLMINPESQFSKLRDIFVDIIFQKYKILFITW